MTGGNYEVNLDYKCNMRPLPRHTGQSGNGLDRGCQHVA